MNFCIRRHCWQRVLSLLPYSDWGSIAIVGYRIQPNLFSFSLNLATLKKRRELSIGRRQLEVDGQALVIQYACHNLQNIGKSWKWKTNKVMFRSWAVGCENNQAKIIDIHRVKRESVLTYLLISLHVPTAASLAEELGQKLLAKQIVNDGFPLTTYESHASLEFIDISNDISDKIDAEVSDWIFQKHSLLKKRKILGKRQKQNLGMPREVGEDVVCLEIKKWISKEARFIEVSLNIRMLNVNPVMGFSNIAVLLHRSDWLVKHSWGFIGLRLC